MTRGTALAQKIGFSGPETARVTFRCGRGRLEGLTGRVEALVATIGLDVDPRGRRYVPYPAYPYG
ncbi:hypothetical protein [Demequina sp.]|uniref:hypothetical protein n=1 Tax=Demequina sp. TaxID=2050685 RepID=UPI003D0A61E1